MSSESSLDRFFRQGKLKRQKTDSVHLHGLLEAARRNFKAARAIEATAEEAAYKLVYDGLLQICRAVLLWNGVRPADGEQHKTTFQVAGEILGPRVEDVIRKIQKFRIKRNDCVYEPEGLITRNDVESIFRTAQNFWRIVRSYLSESFPQIDLFDDL